MKKLMIIIICLLPLIVVASVILSSNLISALTYIPVQNITVIDKYTKEGVDSASIILENYLNDNFESIRTYDLSCRIYPTMSRNHNIIWSSSDQTIASVIDGKVTFNGGYGGVSIFAESEDNRSAKDSVRFFVTDERIRKIDMFLNTTDEMQQFDVARINYSCLPATALSSNIIEWTVEDIQGSNVLSVDNNGVVTANSIGKARAIATINGVIPSSQEQYSVSNSITISVVARTDILKTNKLYVQNNSIDLAPYLSSEATLSCSDSDVEISGTTVTCNAIKPVTVTVSNAVKQESMVISFEGDYLLGFVGLDLLYPEMTNNKLTLWQGSRFLTLIPTVLTVDSNISVADVKFVSDNPEILYVDNNRIVALENGEGTIRLYLEGEEDKAIILTIEVATPIGDFTLNYKQYDDDALYIGSRVFGNYTYNNDKTITNVVPLLISSIDGVPFEETDINISQTFTFTSLNRDIAMVDINGNVYFNEEHVYDGISEATILVTAKFSATSVPISQYYTFKVVKGINVGLGLEVPQYEGGDFDAYESYEHFAALANKVWVVNKEGAQKQFMLKDYNRGEDFGESLERFYGDIVLHCDLYISPNQNGALTLYHGIYGNGNKIDAQLMRKVRTAVWDYTFYVGGDSFTSDYTTISFSDVEFDNCEPKEDVMNYSEIGGIVFNVTPQYGDYFDARRKVVFNRCLFQYSYVHLYGNGGNIECNSVVFRNACYTSMCLRSDNDAPSDLTCSNSIWSNISGPAISAFSAMELNIADCHTGTMTFKGTNYMYNWKTPDNVRLDIIPPENTFFGLTGTQINKMINSTARTVLTSRKDELLVKTEDGKYAMNFGVFVIGMWNTTNKLYVNEPRPNDKGEGFSIVTEGCTPRVTEIDLSQSKAGLVPVINGLGWTGINYLVDLTDANGERVVQPFESYDDLSTEQVQRMLRGGV